MKYTTLYAVFFDDMVDYMYVKDSIIEEYIDEKDSLIEDTMRELFSEWCADEYGWPECDGLWEWLDTGKWHKIF